MYGTLGVLTINNEPFCVTVEPPDKENQVNVSSIPTGQYTCRPTTSLKFGKTWTVLDVPKRSHILFHAGNTINHTEGCIILGQHYGKLKGDLAVLNSGATFNKFMDVTKTAGTLQLTIVEAF
jgi:hypothetical protein